MELLKYVLAKGEHKIKAEKWYVEMELLKDVNLAYIISEPGDATRYKYIIINEGAYYQILDRFEKHSLCVLENHELEINSKAELIKMAEIKKINPWTLQEYINGIACMKKVIEKSA